MTFCNAGSYLNSLDKFALLLAALGHDLGHPGLNNSYQINAKTALALRYNDQCVLEHYHSASLFGILGSSKNNIVSGLSKEDYTSLRGILVASILATDMTYHFPLLQKFNLFLDSLKPAKVCNL